MIAEIVTFYLKEDASLADPNSPASKFTRDRIAPDLISHGVHDAYYGQLIEKPEMGIFFIQWESIDAHKKFIDSPEFEDHMTILYTIVNDKKPIHILHVPFTPTDNPSPAFSGANSKVGVTELVFAYFPSTLTSTEKDGIESSYNKMRPVMEHSELLALYSGWAVEEAVPNLVSQTSEGEICKVFVNLAGWADVDANMRFQGSEEFLRNIHHLMGIKEMRYHELFHVALWKAM